MEKSAGGGTCAAPGHRQGRKGSPHGPPSLWAHVSSPRRLPVTCTSWSLPVDRLLCPSLAGSRAHDMLSPGGLEEAEALQAGDRTGLHVLGPAAETPCATVSSSVKWGHRGVSGQTRPCP